MQKSTEIEPSRTLKSMVSSTRNTCFSKNDLLRKSDEFDLKMTPKWSQNGAEGRSRAKKNASEGTTKKEEKKTSKLVAPNRPLALNLV